MGFRDKDNVACTRQTYDYFKSIFSKHLPFFFCQTWWILLVIWLSMCVYVGTYGWMCLNSTGTVVHILFIFTMSRFIHPSWILGVSEHSTIKGVAIGICQKNIKWQFFRNGYNDFE
jgi:hypothetical protein